MTIVALRAAPRVPLVGADVGADAPDVLPAAVVVAVKRPLGERRPSSFWTALFTARMTVSSAPAAAC